MPKILIIEDDADILKLLAGDLELDGYMDKLDPATRAAGEKAAKPWVDAIKAAQQRP